jgi:hypothetical protein
MGCKLDNYQHLTQENNKEASVLEGYANKLKQSLMLTALDFGQLNFF